MMVSPEVSLTQLQPSTAAGLVTNRAAASLSVLMPLLRNRGGGMARASERSAEGEYDATLLDLRYTIASGVYDAVVAYWGYLAAAKRLEVYAGSEQRAARMVEETRALVRAEERTAADLQQVRANLATKRVTRISAEQSLIEARQQLGLAMGVPAEAIMTLALPSTEFPALRWDTSRAPPTARWVTDAIGHRADLAAAARRREAAQVTLDASQRDVRPQLDLSATIGYAGLERGTGVDQFFAPLAHNRSGLNSSVQLGYQFPITSAAARGRALQAASAYEQRRIAYDDLSRRISAGVAVAAEALRHSLLGLKESEDAVTLSRATVESEKRKLQLGMSTLFDVIQAEDALTNALLAEITGQRNYAVAIASLRFQIGTLVPLDGDRAVVNVDELVTPP
jgi:outer membrane protein TolC